MFRKLLGVSCLALAISGSIFAVPSYGVGCSYDPGGNCTGVNGCGNNAGKQCGTITGCLCGGAPCACN